jgi:glycosyltransferase involved in cell wall biosynthesis
MAPLPWDVLLDAQPSDILDGAAKTPELSIVIPAYNVSHYIEAAVVSALGQTFTDLEVIVVDDGSTDETPSVLQNISKKYADPRLRIIRQDNGGLSAARNTGIRNARGAFIGLLDADDLWLLRKAALQIAMMKRDPTIGVSFSHSEYLTESGIRTGSILLAGKPAPSLHDMIRRNHVGNGSTAIVRRDCFESAGLFRTELRSCEDYEMWCRILWLTEYVAALIPEPLTLYRLRDSSLSFNSMKFVESADLAIDCIRKAMRNVPGSVIRAGHAEHYRIAAWKAISTGHHRAAIRLLARALSMRPLLIFADWRALGTAVAIFIPTGTRNWLAATAKRLQKSFYRVDAIPGA